MFKKIFSILLCIFFIFNIACFADDTVENSEIDKNIIDESIETVSTLNKTPSINSRTAIVIDRNSKTILYGKNENNRVKMASTTKIMTALIVIENSNLNDVIEISKNAAGTGGSRLKLKSGDKITVNDLLYGLMLRSGNDAAVALAEYIGGSIDGFANLMNKKADDIGLKNTHFATPHGLDNDTHFTTAYELAILTDYALNNDIFLKIVSAKVATINVNNQIRTISNTNELLGNLNGVYGVKTGFTNGAGRCLVTATKRDNMNVICVVLGADTKKDRTKDSVKLIEYAFKNYEIILLNNKINETFENWNNLNNHRIHIEKGLENQLNLKLDLNGENILYPILKKAEDDIKFKIISDLNLNAPIIQDTIIGKLQIIYQGEIVREINIICKNKIDKKNAFNYFFEFIKNYRIFLKSALV